MSSFPHPETKLKVGVFKFSRCLKSFLDFFLWEQLIEEKMVTVGNITKIYYSVILLK